MYYNKYFYIDFKDWTFTLEFTVSAEARAHTHTHTHQTHTHTLLIYFIKPGWVSCLL